MLLCELQTKDVINVCTAKCLGRVMDLEMKKEAVSAP
jgi:sporulation protein YlmC with PRC-barrel domain